MTLRPGVRLGAYEIHSAIGAGGMGEVYRARDTMLERDVAIKVLPEGVASDPERLARFEREAKTLAALNHPNIAQIYGLQDLPAEAGSHGYALVMEFVDGPTLADRIPEGPLALDEVIGVARQIADALDAAHDHGIVHRDLKPANIKFTSDHQVKVLDFGLAKFASPVMPEHAAAEASALTRTITTPAMTGVGTILGTAAYMAPEQAKGKEADRRSDVWSFGAVLFEMVTGRRAFEGEDVSDTLAAVLRGDPDWTALPKETPPGLRVILRRCLERDRRKRLHSAGDAMAFIDEMPVRIEVGERRMSTRLVWIGVGLGIIALAATAVALVRPTQSRPLVEPARVSILPPSEVVLTGESGPQLALSPDARVLAFTGAPQDGPSVLWIRDVSAGEARRLSGTERANFPFWSPDGASIGFFQGTDLKVVSVRTGAIRTVCATPGRGMGGTWNAAGEILFTTLSTQFGIQRVPAAGGNPATVVQPDGQVIVHLWFLPDGRRFLFRTLAGMVRLASLDTPSIRDVGRADSQVEVASRHLVFVRNGSLVAQPFDTVRGVTSGEATPVASSINPNGRGYAPFTVSAAGHLAYIETGAQDVSTLTWLDRSGNVLGTIAKSGRFRNPRLSPDNTRLAVELVGDDQNRDIWIVDLARNVQTRFTFDKGSDVFPIWSPDGKHIMFGSDRSGEMSLYRKPADGSAAEELVFTSPTMQAAPYDWAPDGQSVVHRDMVNGVLKTGILSLTGERKSRLYQSVPYNLGSGKISPDGRWLAYLSNESGQYETFVQAFPTPGAKWQASTNGGVSPLWRADGRELFFYAQDGQLMGAPITSGTTLDIGSAAALFRANFVNGPSVVLGFGPQYDVARDGTKILGNVPIASNAPRSISLILNWTSLVGRE